MKSQVLALTVALSLIITSCGTSQFQGDAREIAVGSGAADLSKDNPSQTPIDSDDPAQSPDIDDKKGDEEPKEEKKDKKSNKGGIIGAILAGITVAVGIAIISDDGECKDDESKKDGKGENLNAYHISPFDLAFRVYRGQLANFPHGSYATMCQNLAFSKFDEHDVVDYAIKANLADPGRVDCSYIKAVESQLSGVCN